jgi:hypothetical protein
MHNYDEIREQMYPKNASSGGLGRFLLLRVAKKLVVDSEIQRLFKFNSLAMLKLLEDLEVVFTNNGRMLSQAFKSPYFKDNYSNRVTIQIPKSNISEHVIAHECMHLLHLLTIILLFVDDNNVLVYDDFVSNVLSDILFLNQIKAHGSVMQKNLVIRLADLCQIIDSVGYEYKNQLIKDNAMLFASFAYQHAFFVDSMLCEAVASFHNKGWFLKFIIILNRLIGWLIPGPNHFEGYGNKQLANAFALLPPQKKALLIAKADYNRKEYLAL